MAYNERELLAKHKLLLYADAISAKNIDLRGVEIGAKDEFFAALGVTDYGDKTRFTSLLKELTGNNEVPFKHHTAVSSALHIRIKQHITSKHTSSITMRCLSVLAGVCYAYS